MPQGIKAFFKRLRQRRRKRGESYYQGVLWTNRRQSRRPSARIFLYILVKICYNISEGGDIVKSRTLYVFSLFTWIFNVVALFVNIFWDIKAYCLIIIFFSLIVQTLFSIIRKQKKEKTDAVTSSFFDKLLLWCLTVTILLTIMSGFCGLLAGGNPEYRDGLYCLVNHNTVVKTISFGMYVYFVVCDYLTMFCGALIFSTLLLIITRIQHCKQ